MRSREMLGILVVSYNSEDVLGECLDACLRVPNTRVLVVDNSPGDAPAVPDGVAIIHNATNRGFAGAANQGIAALGTELVLLLNPDVLLGCKLEAMIEAAADPSVGAVGGNLVDKSGRQQPKYQPRRLPSPLSIAFETPALNRVWSGNPFNRVHRLSGDVCEVEQVAGGFLLLKRAAWSRIGGFDETFHPLWFEDVDFCKRLKENGYKILYLPDSRVQHAGGQSANALDAKCTQLYWYGSLLRYSAKHFSRVAHIGVCLAVACGCVPRMVAALVRDGNLHGVSVYSKVMRLAGTSLLAGSAARLGRVVPGR
ncbi:MAG TPA: glycosyltransferase family 2 protein [Bryobacteraceae bacterium]|nr:glycosyltransferase family 2 protein [Bryobacteraceae bacterium]